MARDEIRNSTPFPAGARATRAEWPLTAVVKGLLAFVSVLYVLLFLIVAVRRLRYPFELEWLEGSMVDCVRRVLAGQGLYVAPSVDFTCYQYPPVYYWISAGLSAVLGVGFFALRLVSFTATLGAFALIFLLVRRETGSRLWGAVAAGLFAATFKASGAWFDLAREDSLLVFFLMAAVYVCCSERLSYTRAAATAVLCLLACFTKQVALAPAMAMGLYILLHNWRIGVVFAETLLVGVCGGILALDYANGGWYLYYTIRLLTQHPFVPGMWLHFWTVDMGCHMPIALMAGTAYLALLCRARKSRDMFYPLLTVSMIGISWASRLHSGGVENVLMPAYAVLSVVGTLAISRAMSSAGPLSAPRRLAAIAVVGLLGLAQFGLLMYDPRLQIPSKKSEEAGWRFIERVRSIDGEVYIPCHGFYAIMAGKKNTYAHAMTVYDIFRGTDQRLQHQLRTDLEAAFREKRFAAVIVDSGMEGDYFQRLADTYYQKLPEKLFDDDSVFQVVTSMPVRPEAIYVR